MARRSDMWWWSARRDGFGCVRTVWYVWCFIEDASVRMFGGESCVHACYSVVGRKLDTKTTAASLWARTVCGCDISKPANVQCSSPCIYPRNNLRLTSRFNKQN